jgi:hypothetical protein
MLILQGILFGTFTVVLVGNLFLVRQLFCEGDSTAQTSKATLETTAKNR